MRGTMEDIDSQKKKGRYRVKEQNGRYRLAKKRKEDKEQRSDKKR